MDPNEIQELPAWEFNEQELKDIYDWAGRTAEIFPGTLSRMVDVRRLVTSYVVMRRERKQGVHGG